MQGYISLIKPITFRKYRSSLVKDKNFLDKYLIQRKIFLDSVLINKNFKIKINSIKDQTYREFKKLFSSNNLVQRDKIVLKFYKKFEINLVLKKKYKNYKKKLSSKETIFATYIYLGLLIKNNRYLNNLQKINIILKILDKLSMKSINYTIKEKKLLIKLLDTENNLIKKIRSFA
tara:strand:+ start:68 stop:592 length:525 start_codon:yes stop_codon:yes gene_type:complete